MESRLGAKRPPPPFLLQPHTLTAGGCWTAAGEQRALGGCGCGCSARRVPGLSGSPRSPEEPGRPLAAAESQSRGTGQGGARRPQAPDLVRTQSGLERPPASPAPGWAVRGGGGTAVTARSRPRAFPSPPPLLRVLQAKQHNKSEDSREEDRDGDGGVQVGARSVRVGVGLPLGLNLPRAS